MAGKKIYMGEIMQQVADTLLGHTTALENINHGVAQSISQLNVEAGTNMEYIVNSAEKTSASSTQTPYATVKSICTGSLRFSGLYKPSPTGGNVFYRINGGAWQLVITSGSTPDFIPFSKDFAVAYGDVIDFCITGNSASTTLRAGESKLSYNLKDIVNNGPFSRIL